MPEATKGGQEQFQSKAQNKIRGNFITEVIKEIKLKIRINFFIEAIIKIKFKMVQIVEKCSETNEKRKKKSILFNELA